MRMLLISSIFLSISCFGQDSIACKRSPFPSTGGLVAYYFWEEDSAGFLIPGTFQKPCVQNVIVEEDKKYKLPYTAPSSKEMIDLVQSIAQHDHGNALSSMSAEQGQKYNENYPLLLYVAQDFRSLVFIKRNNEWQIEQHGTVLHFSYFLDGGLRFTSSSDSVVFVNGQVYPSNGNFSLYSWLDEKKNVLRQTVLSYSGEDVTTQFSKPCINAPERLLVFVNGYRGPLKDKDKSDNLVSMKDRYGYWYKLDNRFIERLNPDGTFYLDANFPVRTSVHHSRFRFILTLIRWSCSSGEGGVRREVKRMRKPENKKGFDYRKEKGRLAGKAFIYSRCSTPNCFGVKDTVDIVCHSMGYAYTLGFLEAIQEEVVMGSCYIIAPENAGMDGYDWSRFQKVWQYGANLDQPNADPLKDQDGVAPQTAVKGIATLLPTQGGRIFIPEDWPNKQFIHSHMVYSYDWIFDRLLPGMPGYITTKR